MNPLLLETVFLKIQVEISCPWLLLEDIEEQHQLMIIKYTLLDLLCMISCLDFVLWSSQTIGIWSWVAWGNECLCEVVHWLCKCRKAMGGSRAWHCKLLLRWCFKFDSLMMRGCLWLHGNLTTSMWPRVGDKIWWIDDVGSSWRSASALKPRVWQVQLQLGVGVCDHSSTSLSKSYELWSLVSLVRIWLSYMIILCLFIMIGKLALSCSKCLAPIGSLWANFIYSIKQWPSLWTEGASFGPFLLFNVFSDYVWSNERDDKQYTAMKSIHNCSSSGPRSALFSLLQGKPDCSMSLLMAQ